MAATFPSLTKTWHTESYPKISPSRPELSAANKTVVITGGGTGIGASIANSFALAGCKNMALLGRRLDKLQDVARDLQSNFNGLCVLTLSVDVANTKQVDDAFDAIRQQLDGKPIDILVSNAGSVNLPVPLHEIDDVEDAWNGFEVHCKGAMNLTRAFGRTMAEEGAAVIHTSSIVAILPAFPGASVYTASKLAATKLWTYFGVENPSVRVISYQPGQVNTPMADQLGLVMPDNDNLPGHFVVWLTSPEAQFLNGKFVVANWDVDEMMARKDEFENTDLATLVFRGFPALEA